jgi:hypothetical protein
MTHWSLDNVLSWIAWAFSRVTFVVLLVAVALNTVLIFTAFPTS